MKFSKLIASITLTFISVQSAFPCTEFRLRAKDNSTLITRTMEYSMQMHANLRTSNRNRQFETKSPNGKPGMSWKAKYGYVFFDAFNIDIAVDGMNEKGLSFGALYLPGYTVYQTVPKNRTKDAVSYTRLGDWILGNFSTVAEVKTALQKTYIFQENVPGFGNKIFPLHFSIYDVNGNGLVVEYINGRLTMHDNKIGVLTNSPSYDWHLANLNKYVYLSPVNPNPVSLNGEQFTPMGLGFGMIGLPGDASPSSRFLKMATYLRFVVQPTDVSNAVNLASHIINNVDIPFGIVRSPKQNSTTEMDLENTQWTAFKDLTNKVFYFRTYENLQLRAVSLDKIDFSENAKRLKMSIESPQFVEDLSQKFTSSEDLGQTPNVIAIELTPAENQKGKGNLQFTQMGNTLVISGEVSGLTPGKHGFHIHEHSSCADCHEGFQQAGGHFNPTHVVHGSLDNGHAGDLGNIIVDKNGNAKIFVTTQKINTRNDGNEFSVLNRTVMIHAQEDDLKTDPAGNSGARILCGTIK